MAFEIIKLTYLLVLSLVCVCFFKTFLSDSASNMISYFAYWYCEFYVCSSCVYFLLLGRVLVLYFSLVVPAMCYLFFMHVVCCMCSW